jgi:hypothetical protein
VDGPSRAKNTPNYGIRRVLCINGRIEDCSWMYSRQNRYADFGKSGGPAREQRKPLSRWG